MHKNKPRRPRATALARLHSKTLYVSMLDPTAKRKSIKEARGDRDAQQQFSAGTVGVDNCKGAGWHEQLN